MDTAARNSMIKDQTILGLKEQLIRMEKLNRDFEKRYIKMGGELMEKNTFFLPTQNLFLERLLKRHKSMLTKINRVNQKNLIENNRKRTFRILQYYERCGKSQEIFP